MAKIPRLYTRGGDDGTTGLIGGGRVPKDALRIAAYGTVDELSSALGVARAFLHTAETNAAISHAQSSIDAWLSWVQDALFNVGSELASPDGKSAGVPVVEDRDVAALERAIDQAQDALPPLRQFIHPGGSHAGAFLHLARTVCRRAERAVVTLNAQERVSGNVLRYLNRLSDALFVWARLVNHTENRAEAVWDSAAAPPAAAGG